MNKRTKVILLTFLGTLIVAILSLNATYSYMKNKTSGDKNTDVKVNSCAKISLKENSNTINLTNMYPMDDEMGLQTTSYDFTVSSTCDNYVGFDLYLTTYESDIDDSTIKYAIISKNDTVLASDLLTSKPDGEKDFTDAEKNQLNSGVTKDYKKIYKVFTNNIPLKGESEYKLRIWIDNSNAVDTTMGKSFNIGVSVKSFDRDESMAEYLINKKDDTLLYHNGTIKSGDIIIDAQDYSYRYSGESADVHNYVCLGTDNNATGTCDDNDLYRIIGFFINDTNNYEMKLIKNTPYEGDDAESSENTASRKGYRWSGSILNKKNTWKDSTINTKVLNTDYLHSLPNYIQSKIIVHTYITTGNSYGNLAEKYVYETYKNEIQNPILGEYATEQDKTCNTKIALMYISDYGYATYKDGWTAQILRLYDKDDNIKMNNWLFINDNKTVEWFLTRGSDGIGASNVYGPGNVGGGNVYGYLYAIRPVFYLDNNTMLKSNGEGTLSHPYRIA